VRVALPPLLLIRTTTEDRNPQYQVYAVKARPITLDAPLFHAPLPNIFNSGSICWGSVRRVEDSALHGNSLSADWSALLGSPFGDHVVNGKSRSHPHDIRQQLLDLESRKARVYPKSMTLTYTSRKWSSLVQAARERRLPEVSHGWRMTWGGRDCMCPVFVSSTPIRWMRRILDASFSVTEIWGRAKPAF